MTHFMDATGLHTDSYETIRQEIVDSIHADISPVADLSEESPMGSFVSRLAFRERTVVELAEETYAGSYRSTSDGFQLDMVGSLTGCYREEATRSSISLAKGEVYLDAGVTLPAGSIAHVDGNPDARFVTTVAVTNPAGIPAWIPCAFEAESTGPVQCLASTLRTIAEPVIGWIIDGALGYGVNNTGDAVLGADEETDSAYRVRQVVEIYQGGSATVRAILADLSAMTDMVAVMVLENDGDWTSADGLPAHSVGPVVYDGAPAGGPHVISDDDIAAAILGGLDSGKAAGIRSWGSTVVGVEDSQGENHEIGFTRVDELDLYVVVDLSGAGNYDEDLYPAGVGLEAAVKAALVAWGDANLGISDDVIYLRLVAVVLSVDGVFDITALTSGWAPAPVGVVNLAVGRFELANVDTANVTVAV